MVCQGPRSPVILLRRGSLKVPRNGSSLGVGDGRFCALVAGGECAAREQPASGQGSVVVIEAAAHETLLILAK